MEQLPIDIYRKAPCISLYSFFEQIQNQVLRLPRYQRTYVWTKKNVQTLLEDIDKKIKDNKFIWLGVILLSQESSSLSIIDGQQRILSFLLILFIFMGNNNLTPDFISEDSWEDFWKNDQMTKDTIYYGDVLQYIHNKENHNSKLNPIVKIIHQFRDNNDLEIDKWRKFIKERVLITIILVSTSDTCDYFENINSKNIPLNLTDKCFAFLTIRFKTKILENKHLFQWWLYHKDKKKITEYFIKIFWIKYQSEHRGDYSFLNDFDKFKKIVEWEFETFLFFLNVFQRECVRKVNSLKSKDEFKKILSSKNPDIFYFYYYYLYQVAWTIYLPIVIALKFKGYFDIFNNNLLKKVWKIDLWIHLLNKGKSLNPAKVISTAGNIITYTEANVAQELDNFFIEQINLIDSSYSGGYKKFTQEDFSHIERDPNNNPRIKILFWWLLIYKNTFNSSDIINSLFKIFSLEIEHIVPKKNNLGVSFYKIESIFNLLLISHDLNKELTNKNPSDKIIIYNNDLNNSDNHLFNAEMIHSWSNIKKQNINMTSIWNINKKLYIEKFNYIKDQFNLKLLYKTPQKPNILDEFLKKEKLSHLRETWFLNPQKEKYYIGKTTNRNKEQTQWKVNINEKVFPYLKQNFNQIKIFALHRNDNKIYYLLNKKKRFLDLKKSATGPNITFNQTDWIVAYQ